ncbi:hypothetical protein HK26_00215 [Acetobacter okinawensis]|uniref:Uncharacterized protein n=1 Tax=Acetobacter okinawensis TaxID=1076594 RepID=A0A252BYX0_9PROT|nr:hypothetical protein HK26_00215 [Acetobacter okinawensis]
MATSGANVNPKRPVTSDPFRPFNAYVICGSPHDRLYCKLTPILAVQAFPYPLKCYASKKRRPDKLLA